MRPGVPGGQRFLGPIDPRRPAGDRLCGLGWGTWGRCHGGAHLSSGPVQCLSQEPNWRVVLCPTRSLVVFHRCPSTSAAFTCSDPALATAASARIVYLFSKRRDLITLAEAAMLSAPFIAMLSKQAPVSYATEALPLGVPAIFSPEYVTMDPPCCYLQYVGMTVAMRARADAGRPKPGR